MDEGLRQTIERVKRQNTHVLPITNMVQHVPSDIQRLIVAAKRAEVAEVMISELRRYVSIVDWAEAEQRAQWRDMAQDAKHLRAEMAEKRIDGWLEVLAAERQRAEAAEARVKELEAQIASLLPAAQSLVTSIEFIPIPASNAAADSALLTGTGETSGGNAHDHNTSAMLPNINGITTGAT